MKAIFSLIAILLVSQSLADFSGMAIGTYTRWYFKESGASKATNNSSFAAWGSCTPELATCLTFLPSELSASTTKAECHTNSGAKSEFDFGSNTALFNGLSDGTGLSSQSNFVDTICGKTVANNEFVAIYIFEDAQENNDTEAETAALFQSQMRNWYLFDSAEPVNATLSIEGDGPTVNIAWEVRIPPQGSGINFSPIFVPTPGNTALQDSWSNLNDTDYCQTPSTFNSVDSDVNTTLTLALAISYDDYLTYVQETQNAETGFETSRYEIQLLAYSCDAQVPQEDVQKKYISQGVIDYDPSVEAQTSYGVSHQTSVGEQLKDTLEMEATLSFCTDSTCSQLVSRSPAQYFVNEDAYVLLQIPGSNRRFTTIGRSVEDGRGNSLSGEIELTTHDSSQAGRIIYKVSFQETQGYAVLSVAATAVPPSRILADGDEVKTQSAVQTASFKVVNTDEGDEGNKGNDEDDDDSSSAIYTSFAALLAALLAVF